MKRKRVKTFWTSNLHFIMSCLLFLCNNYFCSRWPLLDSQRRWRSHSLFSSMKSSTGSLPSNLQMSSSSSYYREEENDVQIPEIRWNIFWFGLKLKFTCRRLSTASDCSGRSSFGSMSFGDFSEWERRTSGIMYQNQKSCFYCPLFIALN